MQLLLEAPITPDQVNKFLLPRDNQVSIFYDKKWISVEPVRVQEIDGEEYLIAFEVSNPQATTPVRYELKKITNWNVLSKKSAPRAKKEKGKRVVKAKAPGGDKIEASIVNKRVVSFYYQGDKENNKGYRNQILPVCYGTTKGVKYLRAWQAEGYSYRNTLDSDSKEYREVPGWRFFRVDRISINTFKETGKNFIKAPDSNYNPAGDEHIKDIIAKATFDNEETPPPPAPEEPKAPAPTKGKKKLQENKIISAILDAVRIL